VQDDSDSTPPDEVIFDASEALSGSPPKVTAAEGIRLMRERQESLLALIACTTATPENETLIIRWRKELQDTKQRLAEYQSLLKQGQN
jgi:hypothetical protein